MPQFIDEPSQNERERIQQFLSDVYRLLADVVETGRDPNGNTLISDRDVQRELRAAWADSGQYFESVHSVVAEVSERSLQEHGLYGNQLGAKFTVTGRHWTRFLSKGGGRLFRKLIEVIDDLLDSILQALGASGAISELKDLVKNATDEDE
jgi:hypothetical protein